MLELLTTARLKLWAVDTWWLGFPRKLPPVALRVSRLRAILTLLRELCRLFLELCLASALPFSFVLFEPL